MKGYVRVGDELMFELANENPFKDREMESTNRRVKLTTVEQRLLEGSTVSYIRVRCDGEQVVVPVLN